MKSLLTKSLAVSTVAGLGLIAAPAVNAATFTGTFNDVTFSDGGGLSGTFTYEPEGVYTDVVITTTAGADVTTGADFSGGVTPATFNLSSPGPNSGTVFSTNTPGSTFSDYRAINLTFQGDIGVAGTYNIAPFASNENLFNPAGGQFRFISGGTITTVENVDPIPEPLTMLGASAAVAFGAAFKKRQNKNG